MGQRSGGDYLLFLLPPSPLVLCVHSLDITKKNIVVNESFSVVILRGRKSPGTDVEILEGGVHQRTRVESGPYPQVEG